MSTFVVAKLIATAIGSIVASIILTRVSLDKGASFGELVSNGTTVSVLGSFLFNVVYHLMWGYVRELCGVRAAIETFIMFLRSGVFLYMFVVDLIVSFTSILLALSLVFLIFIGE